MAASLLHEKPMVALAAFVILPVTMILLRRAMPSHCFLGARRPAEGQPDSPLPVAAAVGAALAGTASRRWLPYFLALCLATSALLHAEWLVGAAADGRLNPGVVPSVAMAALFHWAILSISFFVARRPAARQADIMFRLPGAAPPIGPSPHFVVLCLAMGALQNTEALVAAATEVHLRPSVVACVLVSIAALFNWNIFSLNVLVARVPNRPLRLAAPAASQAASPILARCAFALLAAMVAASWFVFVGPFATDGGLPSAVAAVTVVLFAALFNLSIHLFCSSFSF